MRVTYTPAHWGHCPGPLQGVQVPAHALTAPVHRPVIVQLLGQGVVTAALPPPSCGVGGVPGQRAATLLRLPDQHPPPGVQPPAQVHCGALRCPLKTHLNTLILHYAKR